MEQLIAYLAKMGIHPKHAEVVARRIINDPLYRAKLGLLESEHYAARAGRELEVRNRWPQDYPETYQPAQFPPPPPEQWGNHQWFPQIAGPRF